MVGQSETNGWRAKRDRARRTVGERRPESEGLVRVAAWPRYRAFHRTTRLKIPSD